MDCVFCSIVKNQLPAYKILEDDHFLAFLSIAPINPGHTLIIPKHHQGYLFDEDMQTLSQILPYAKPIAQALKKAFQPKTGKIGLIVAGQGVAHTHLHLIPMDAETDLDFKRAKHNLPESEFRANLELIKSNLEE
ncbi:HIT family protein [Patescibacteria group bacterium]|nr:HIT family protein [Patescibacteria group bacterium]MCL5409774.1 HIT family protein [Patescibacteria group bacterium]